MSEPAMAEPADPEPAMFEPAIAAPDPEPDPPAGAAGVSLLSFLQAAGASASAANRSVPTKRMRYPPSRMLRRFGIGFICMAALVASAMADPDIRMPPGTRKDETGQL